MTLSLTGLALFVGAALAGVNLLTEEPIAAAKQKALNEALAKVLPPFDNDISSAKTEGPDNTSIYPASLNGMPAGAAVETWSDNGFSGHISILVGFDNNGTITGYQVLQHAETPGLGAKMDTWFNIDGSTHNVLGTDKDLKVKADGGNIDAITGATITSRAFLEAVNRARKAFNTLEQ